uniref:Uncharacterized protein n=1 Tax=Anguilla anguilla TaxID=7936 RepID=A0A0E9QCI3_ANGAN
MLYCLGASVNLLVLKRTCIAVFKQMFSPLCSLITMGVPHTNIKQNRHLGSF